MVVLTNQRKAMPLRHTNKANQQFEDYTWKKSMKYLFLVVRNIKEGADTRSHKRKANSIFSFVCIIQVDNDTCTKIKRLSLNPAWDSPAGSCITAHEPLQQGVHFLLHTTVNPNSSVLTTTTACSTAY